MLGQNSKLYNRYSWSIIDQLFFLEIEEQRQPFILSGQDQSLMPLPIISSTSRTEDISSKTWGDQPKPKDLKPPNDR